CVVIVASWNETSNFFTPGANRLVQGVYIHSGVRPSCFAISFATSTSYPFGLTTVEPRTVPAAKPTAGSPKATTSLPGCITGGAAEAAGTATAAAARSAATIRRFTEPS